MSAQAWVDEDCRRLLAVGVPRIVQGLKPFGVKAVFLGGSAALGEAVGWEGAAGEQLLLSDLDLGAVVSDPVPPGLARSLVAPGPGEAGTLTLGCYERRFLDAQDSTPGMADLAAEGHLLWGDPAAFRMIKAPEPGSIPVWEAYRLLGNRCLELDAAEEAVGGDPGPWRRVRSQYALAKAATDLWTSWMIAQGAYCTGWQERSARLDHDTLNAPDGVIRVATAFREFRMLPCPGSLPSAGEPGEMFAAGLRAWLEADPGRFRRPGRGPEDALLREPARLRSRLQRWRMAWGRPGLPRFAFRLARERIWHCTPEGVRMAHSVCRRIGQA